jgi:hypothetical protein
MPQEISDIKNVSLPLSALVGERLEGEMLIEEQFIEICRRKDASCTFSQLRKFLEE